MSPDRGATDRLNEQLDAVVSGARIRPGVLDSTLGDVVERFYEADDAPGPPPGLADQIWKELNDRAALIELVPHDLTAHHDRNGRTAQPIRRDTPPDRGSNVLAFLATAALIVLTLIGGIVASRGSWRLPGPDEQAAIIPAIDNALESELLPGVSADVILLQATLEQMPSAGGTPRLSLYRVQLAPGAVEDVGKQADTGMGNELFTIESGQVTVEADAPVLITRAGAGTADASSVVESGTAVVLEVGDQLFAPNGVSFRRRNDALNPATVLSFSIGTVGDNVNTWSDPPGVTETDGFPFKLPGTYPTVPAEATVHRLTLAPGAELAVRDLPGLELVYVDSGTLELISAKAEPLGRTPERGFTLRAGSGTESFGRTPEQAVLANRGAEPLVILTASLVPANDGEATPPPAWSDGWGSGDHVLQ